MVQSTRSLTRRRRTPKTCDTVLFGISMPGLPGDAIKAMNGLEEVVSRKASCFDPEPDPDSKRERLIRGPEALVETETLPDRCTT